MIRIDKLVKRFGSQPILRGATLSISRGDVAVLIGASGSGKSTLLRCVNGLETFDDGRIDVDGLSLSAGMTPSERAEALRRLRRRVGMVFQQFNLFPHMSVLENVLAGPRHVLGVPRDVAEPKARELLDRVGMSAAVDRRPGTLSGGQQQRVAIARALAMEPVVMLFDEPTSALDPRMTAEVLSVMSDLAASGQTMLVVSHAMGFVRRSARTVHVLIEGQVVESGPPEQVFEAARHPGTRELLAHSELS
ncbi:MAG: amino acid ABC transporter ATP-binding protein [Phycisphaerae bacterium]|nr:amino acid ABC transporter ATP-binding protein [Phycisphaerae bacterium]